MAFVTDNSARVKAENKLKTRNIELDAFAHTVAHDLNSTLNGIIGYSDLLIKGGDEFTDDEKKQFIQNIFDISKKMSTIIHELLIFATMDKNEVELQRVNMKKTLNDSLSRLSFMVKNNQAEITQEEMITDCFGYAPWIEEVWYNIISNAIKYGGDPPIIIIKSESIENGLIKYSVHDNGRGLNSEQVEKIFKSANISGKGFGLGLSIVTRILDKLNGKLDVESNPGKGTIFNFYLMATPDINL